MSDSIVEVQTYAPRGRRKTGPRKRVSMKKRGSGRIKKKKPSTTRKADTLFSRFIRERDGKCVRCGKAEYLQNSHFWPRAISSVRYDPQNCDTLCYGCHYGDRVHGWEYAKQGDYRDFKIKQLGEEGYKSLALRATITVKRKDAIESWLDHLREIQATDPLKGTANIAA